ncbi:MAG TPA: LytTR family DNA-binding domain-containing protein [Bacteroidales bacterium]|nr:LytTR family DNA-binding domain-containing protein [Bacteroidales bacterium]
MLKFLNKPYPFNDDLRHNAKVIIFISLGILVYLFVFQPIEINLLSKKNFFYLGAGLTLSTFTVLTINLIIIPSLFKKQFVKWTIKKEIIWNLLILLSISTCDFFFYTHLFGIINIRYSDISNILLLGLLPVAILIIINQNRLLKKHLKEAKYINQKLIDKKRKEDKLVHFESDYKKDNLIIRADSIILIKAADNYVEVFYESEGIVKKQLIRMTLKKVEQLLSEYDYLIRSHRSYIVNIHQIKEIQGNADGYKLFFNQNDLTAFVSQKFIDEFKKII